MERLPDDQLLAMTPRRPEAFAVFYRRHEQTLLGWLMRQTGDPELAAALWQQSEELTGCRYP